MTAIDALPAILAIGLVGVLGYGIGALSSGYLVGKLYRRVDLRRVGSGSTGATNTWRALGPGAGLLVAGLDILKGAVAVWVAILLVPVDGDVGMLAQAVAAVGAIVGHCWPAFLEGRGGRGVAPALGAFMVIASPAWIASVAAFVLAVAVTRMISVGSLAAAAGALVGYVLLARLGVMPFHWAALSFLVAATTIIVWRHRPNIDRILRGAEPRVGEAPKS